MSKIWFTSDLHLGHENIIKYCNRPFVRIGRMETAFVDNFNDVVKPGDTTYFLGDIVMGNKQINLKVIKKLNGYKILIAGNHDNVFDGLSAKAQKNMAMYREYFDEIHDTLHIDGGDIWPGKIVLNHFPNKNAFINDSSDERRFLNHRLEDDGKSLYFHGHVHCQARVTGDRSIHVGVDAWNYKPVSLDEIRNLIKEMGWHKYSFFDNLKWRIKNAFGF